MISQQRLLTAVPRFINPSLFESLSKASSPHLLMQSMPSETQDRPKTHLLFLKAAELRTQTCMQEYASAGKVLSIFKLLNGCTFCKKLWALCPCSHFFIHSKLCTSRLCMKMSSFCMRVHVQCRVHYIHHAEFYFRFGHLITFPV